MSREMGPELLDGWSQTEQDVVRAAFEQAYQRTVERLIADLKEKATALCSAESVWELHDFLSIERHTIEGRFSFASEGILFVMASFVKDDLLKLDELEGLEAEKLAKIAAMSRF